MQERGNGNANAEPECERTDLADEKRPEKGSYYYDDAHGYEDFDPSDDDADDLETSEDKD